jgi:hypothetical protein
MHCSAHSLQHYFKLTGYTRCATPKGVSWEFSCTHICGSTCVRGGGDCQFGSYPPPPPSSHANKGPVYHIFFIPEFYLLLRKNITRIIINVYLVDICDYILSKIQYSRHLMKLSHCNQHCFEPLSQAGYSRGTS